MIRVVRTPEGVRVDPSGKHPGRGAYLHEIKSCWEAGMQGGLARSLRANFTPEDLHHLLVFISSLPEEISTEQDSNS
jgi:predicted RNA-binding protein YlxR (DUF448 family)